MNTLLSSSDVDIHTANGDEIVMKDGNESGAKTYRVKSYFRSSFNRKFSEYLTCTLVTTTIIIVGLIALIVITSAILKYQIYTYSDSVALQNAMANGSSAVSPVIVSSSNDSEYRLIAAYENRPHEEDGVDARSWLNFTERVVLNDNDNLWAFDTENETLSVLHEAESGSIDAFDLSTEDSIFLSTFNGTFASISALYRDDANATGYNDTRIFEETRVRARSMAFDHVGGNLYVVDEAKGTLVVIDVHTRDFNVLLADLIQPSKILLDPSKGVMFILQLSYSIIKADMNGENLNVIVEKSGISALTVDPKHERVYWVNDVVGIESSDYDGKNLRYFHTDTATIVDMSVWNDRLYWLWQDHHHMSKHQLIFCRATDGEICEDYVMQPLNGLQNPTSIKVISSEKVDQTTANPCKINRGKCEQLCLVIPRGRRSCACKLGWQLNPDKRTCRETRDFLLYATDSAIRGRTLDVTRRVLTDVILPTPYSLESLKSTIVFDYDHRHDDFYFSDGKNVFKMRLKAGYRNRTTLLEYNENVITDLAYDWLSGNLYVSEYEDKQIYYYTDGIKHYIKAFDVDRDAISRQVALKSFTNGYYRHSSMTIHPSKHYIFYIATLVYTQSIYRLSTTANTTLPFGTLQDVIANLARPTAIDYQENRLYWIYVSDQLTRIDHANLDGSDVKSIIVADVNSPSYIYVYREWIFLANLNTIWRVKKKDGKNVVTMVSRNNADQSAIYDVRLISDAIQSAR